MATNTNTNTNTNKRFGYKVNPVDVNPYQFTSKQDKLLERMERWYREIEGNTIFEIHLDFGQKDILSYNGVTWGDYIKGYIGRKRYGAVAKVVLNELRSIYIQYINYKTKRGTI
jgi:hypothetical protein